MHEPFSGDGDFKPSPFFVPQQGVEKQVVEQAVQKWPEARRAMIESRFTAQL